jgi:hypothetical protein
MSYSKDCAVTLCLGQVKRVAQQGLPEPIWSEEQDAYVLTLAEVKQYIDQYQYYLSGRDCYCLVDSMIPWVMELAVVATCMQADAYDYYHKMHAELHEHGVTDPCAQKKFLRKQSRKYRFILWN